MHDTEIRLEPVLRDSDLHYAVVLDDGAACPKTVAVTRLLPDALTRAGAAIGCAGSAALVSTLPDWAHAYRDLVSLRDLALGAAEASANFERTTNFDPARGEAFFMTLTRLAEDGRKALAVDYDGERARQRIKHIKALVASASFDGPISTSNIAFIKSRMGW